MTEALHHYHKRKRIHQKYEPIPHPDRFKRIFDKVMYPIGIVGPALGIPQVLKIFVEKEASSVSIFTWSGFIVISIIWLTYGILHREKPIIIANIGYMSVQGLIVLGAIMYR